MSFKVIPTPTFAKSLKALAKRHRSLKEDVKAFVAELERDPLQGVELTAGVRKIRCGACKGCYVNRRGKGD